MGAWEKLRAELGRKLTKEEAVVRCVVLTVATLLFASVVGVGLRAAFSTAAALIGGR